VVDKKGNNVTSSLKGIIPFVVEISQTGKQQQQVKIEENQGKEGEGARPIRKNKEKKKNATLFSPHPLPSPLPTYPVGPISPQIQLR